MSALHLSSGDAVAQADPQAVMDAHAKSFSWAARFLLPDARRDAAQLYAFARLADDLADESSMGTLSQRMAQLQAMRCELNTPWQETKTSSLAATVGQLMCRHAVNPAVPHHFMDSLVADAGPRQLQTTQDLLYFAYGGAGTVGQMMRPILGAPREAESSAMALGIGMQLTNIARDVMEDAARGRCYLPAEWGVDLKAVQDFSRQASAKLTFTAIKKILQLADDFYAYGLTGLALIPHHNRRAIHIAAALYRGIGRKILCQGAVRYWRGRTSLSRWEKSTLIAQCYLGATASSQVIPRDVVRVALQHLQGIPGFPG